MLGHSHNRCLSYFLYLNQVNKLGFSHPEFQYNYEEHKCHIAPSGVFVCNKRYVNTSQIVQQIRLTNPFTRVWEIIKLVDKTAYINLYTL